MGVSFCRRGWLPLVLVVAFCLIWASSGLAAPPSAPPAVGEPDAIPGYWVQQRLGTPDLLLTFVDANHGWGTSNSLRNGVFRTEDGGATWDVTVLGDDYDQYTIGDIFFINAQEGWVTGHRDYYDLPHYDAFIAHTSDGGRTWQNQALPRESGGGSRIWFVTPRQGWVESDSILFRTTDGGATWTELPMDGFSDLIRFINASTGFALMTTVNWETGQTTMTLRRTDDAGATWTNAGPVPLWTNDVWIGSGGKTVWVVGNNGKISRSLDTGATWTQVASPTTNSLELLRFTDSQYGWAAGISGTILRTTDGGASWSRVETGTGNNIWSLAASGATDAWIYAGEIRRTRDGGARWSALRSTPAAPLSALAMPSASVGWTGGSYSFLTTNDGRRWIEQAAMGGSRRLDAIDTARAWSLWASNLKRTSDGGSTWETFAAPQGALSIDFVDAARGWLITQEAIFRTTNGGQTWTQQYASTDYTQLQALAFADAQHGWVAGTKAGFPADHILLRTTDGGLTWREAASIGYGNYYDGAVDMSFISATTGWGIDGASIQQGPGIVARTTDGGASWRGVSPAESELYSAIDFLDAQEGWVAGTLGRIYRTTNGGDSWALHQLPSRITVRAIDAVAPGQAIFVGDGGLILQYSATQPPGCWATPTPAPTSNQAVTLDGTVQRRVAHCMDDTYVRVDTEEQLYDREYVRMGARDGGSISYTDGFLFRDVRIPPGADITSARLRLEAEGHQSGAPVIVSIAGEAQAQSGDFNPANWWAHLRDRTVATVPWTISATAGGVIESPDLSAVIEEIVGLGDWQAGNNLSILIDAGPGGQQYVNWWAYDGKPSAAAELVVSYRAGNTPTPTVTPAVTPSPTPTRGQTGRVKVYLPLTLSK